MPRPKSKEELLIAGEEQFDNLWTLIDSMPDNVKLLKFHFEDRDRYVRDVLVHLYEWHLLLIDWINKNLNGEKKAFLPKGYNWKTFPDLNLVIREMYQDTSYEKAKELLMGSHKDAMELIGKFTNEELFTKKYYNWSGTTSVGSYCVSATSTHYVWAMKKIKKHIKTLF